MNYAGKNFLLILSLLFLQPLSLLGQEGDVIKNLIEAIGRSEEYDRKKLEKIKELEGKLKEAEDENLISQYLLNMELFHEYRIFMQDSAFKYGLGAQELARKIDSVPLMADATLSLANVSVSAGMFKEAMEYLEEIEPGEIPENIRSSYYGLMGRCYNDMAEFSNLSYFTTKYNQAASNYHHSALALAEPGTFNHSILRGYIQYKKEDLNMALDYLKPLLEQDLDLREKAVVHSVLGDIYTKKDEKDKAIYHLSQAAIADIKTSAKENLAMIRLAELFFREGDLDKASIFIKKANTDAEFYGAQQRKLRVGAVLPLIEQQIIEQIEKQRQDLYRQNIIGSILLLFVVILTIVIYSQVGRLKSARKVIVEAHEKLQRKNQQVKIKNREVKAKNKELKKVNKQLLEVNKIKEEYIGFFFTRDAEIFEKFSEFKQKIEKNLSEKNLSKLEFTVRNYDLKKEKEKLLRSFDEAFIKLFPDFIEEFNNLLKPEEQISVKKTQILNKELRIFALMRLGITHNEVIAQILGYSVTSIYTYKSKIRNKSPFSTRDFNEKLLHHTTVKL